MGRWTRVRGGRATLLPALGDDRVREGMDRNGRCRRTRCVNRRVGKRRPAHREAGRHTATPDVARELSQIWHETDVRAILGSVRAPSLLLTGRILPTSKRRRTWPRCCPTRGWRYMTCSRNRARRQSSSGGSRGRSRRWSAWIASLPRSCSPTSLVCGEAVIAGDRDWKDLVGRHRDRAREPGAMAWGRERHGGRRVLRDLRRTGTRHPLLA